MNLGRGGRTFVWAAVAVCLAFARPAFAVRPPTPQILSQAQKQVDAGDFEGALITLQDGLSSPDNSNEELEQLYWRMGEVYVYLNRERAALDTFDRLLYLDANFEAPRLTSPRVKKAFEKARTEFVASGRQVALEVPPQKVPQPNRPIAIEARIVGLRSDFHARVYYRQALTEAWGWAELSTQDVEEGRYLAELPPFPAGTTLEYYVEIQGPDRRRVQGEGSSLAPKTLKVAAPERGSTGPLAPPPPAVNEERWYEKGWIWGVVGAAVVAGGVAAYFALQPEPATLNLKVQVSP